MRNPSTIRRPLLIGLAVSSILALSSAFGRMQQQSPATAGRACASDAECNDGVFCNGIERCAAAGCIAGTPPCNAGQRCDEGHRGCVNAGCDNPDRDGDGHRSPRCGGDDCDDNDANRFPGRTEVCDAAGHDEDCDPATYGARDVDGDNEDDIRCCNRETNGTLHCGTDYDDNNSAVRSGSMICDGPDAVVVSGSSSVKCPDGTKCLVQPNGTGICTVPPANYVAPERFTRPPAPPTLPRLPSDIRLDPENIPPAIPREQGGSPVTSNPVIADPQGILASSEPLGGSAAEVAECKKTLQSGDVSWGGGTSWAPANIDRLCSGTKDAKKTVACFQSNVEALGWAAAIEKCK